MVLHIWPSAILCYYYRYHFFKWLMYLIHFSGVSVFLYSNMASINSSKLRRNLDATKAFISAYPLINLNDFVVGHSFWPSHSIRPTVSLRCHRSETVLVTWSFGDHFRLDRLETILESFWHFGTVLEHFLNVWDCLLNRFHV